MTAPNPYVYTGTMPANLNVEYLQQQINTGAYPSPPISAGSLPVTAITASSTQISITFTSAITTGEAATLDGDLVNFVSVANPFINLTTALTAAFGSNVIIQSIAGGAGTVIFSIPNISTNDTFAVLNAAQTLDYKTMMNALITDNSNEVISRALWANTGSTAVSTYTSPAPSDGYILVATSPNTAEWKVPSSIQVFGAFYQTQIASGTTTSTSTSPTMVVEMVVPSSGSLANGYYYIGFTWTWYFTGNSGTNAAIITVEEDIGTPTTIYAMQAQNQNTSTSLRFPGSGFEIRSLAAAATPTYRIKIASTNNTDTVGITDPRLIFYRVS